MAVTFKELLVQYDNSYQHYSFNFGQGDSLRQVNKFPPAYGVYLIQDLSNNEILYIGKSGTLKNGYSSDDYKGNPRELSWKPQTLNERITAKESKKENRETFFKRMMVHDRIEVLGFKCWQLSDGTPRDFSKLPGEAEAELISAFIRDQGHLPKWNKSF